MSTENYRPLNIIALFDGRPGHEKQTRGILRALQEKIPIRVVEVKVKKESFLHTVMRICSLYLPGTGLSISCLDRADLIIGAGTATHAPMLLYKKKYAVPAVICMTPFRSLRKLFDLCFVPEHDGISEGENVMITLGAPNCSINKKQHRKECGLILLGGVDKKSHYWESANVVGMVEKIISTTSEKIWTISSSPRTPPETVFLLEKLGGKYHNFRFFDYQKTGAGWIEAQYDTNSEVWVTADSISMIYEALSAGCKVGILPMDWVKKNSKFQRNENVLLQKKMVTSFASWEHGETTVSLDKELNEADKCADRILQKWDFRGLQ